jgi:hypothetical protein
LTQGKRGELARLVFFARRGFRSFPGFSMQASAAMDSVNCSGHPARLASSAPAARAATSALAFTSTYAVHAAVVVHAAREGWVCRVC